MTPREPEAGAARLTLLLGAVLVVGVVAAAVAFEGAARRTPGCDDVRPTAGFPGSSGEESCRLPDVVLERLGTGGRLALRDLRGPAVVNFWATWCEPCVDEMPLLARAARDLEGQVAFLGVNVQDRDGPALALAERTGVTYPLASDPRGELYEAVRGAGMPTTLFVAADGTVVYRRTGEVDAERLAELLRTHLGVAWEGPAEAAESA